MVVTPRLLRALQHTPGGRVRVAPMKPRHVAAVHAIEAQVYPRPWSTTLFRRELQQADRAYLVALQHREVVGYAGVFAAAGEAHVLTVAVDPAAHRRGIATHLVVELLGAARELGAHDVTLEVRESNEAATALYRRFGFVSEGVRPGYYEDNGEGARIMWLRGLADDVSVARVREQAARVGRALPAPLRTSPT